MEGQPITGCSWCSGTAGWVGCPHHGPHAHALEPWPQDDATVHDVLAKLDQINELLRVIRGAQLLTNGGWDTGLWDTRISLGATANVDAIAKRSVEPLAGPKVQIEQTRAGGEWRIQIDGTTVAHAKHAADARRLLQLLASALRSNDTR